MCGRSYRCSDKQRIAEHFQLHPGTMPDFILSYNVAPQTFQRIIRLNLAPIVAIGLFCAGTRLRLGSRTFASAAHRGYYVAIIGAAGQFRVEVRCRSSNLNRRY